MRTSLVIRVASSALASALVTACADDNPSDPNSGNMLTGSTSGSGATTNGSPSTGTTATTALSNTTSGAMPTPGPTNAPSGVMTSAGPTNSPSGTMTNAGPTNSPSGMMTNAGPTTSPGTSSAGPMGDGGSGGTGPAVTAPDPSASGGETGMPPGDTGGGGAGPEPMPTTGEGPCDIYDAAGTPCVAAYSTIRKLLSTYDGPLYQVRSGSNAENTGSGGELHDIGMTADGFADAAAQDAVCAGTLCTISLLYDQSGRGNNLPVAKRGRSDGGSFAAMDDFESIADAGPLTVGGKDVYSLYMEARQGYRQTSPGDGVPRDQEPQGIYMLADGTHYGTACCWDFGNVTPDPTQYHVMNTLFLGVAFWGRGAGNGPWFMADFEAGVWAGGSQPGEPGWGALDEPAPANESNPSMQVPYALGFLKTGTDYALRMADVENATDITTAYEGPLPKPMDNQGAIVLGVGGDNSNNSWGTFYEGAVVAGYPTDETELAVMKNIQSAGYGQ